MRRRIIVGQRSDCAVDFPRLIPIEPTELFDWLLSENPVAVASCYRVQVRDYDLLWAAPKAPVTFLYRYGLG